MKKDAPRAVALLAIAVTLLACASCTREATLQQARTVAVDEAGGSVTASDGRLTVTLPEGALSTRAKLEVRIASDLRAPGLVGPAYELSPDGVAFAEPALLAFKIDDPALRTRAKQGEIVVARLEQDGWEPLEESWSEDDGHVVLGLTPHFSTYGLVELGPCAANTCAPRERCFRGGCYAVCPSDAACDQEDPCYNPYRCGAQECQQTTCLEGEQCFFGACFARCGDDAECAPSETCVSGRCVSYAPTLDAGPEPEPDAGPPVVDSGPEPELDAGPPIVDSGPEPEADAGPQPECVTSSDCALGETCVPDSCLLEGVCVVEPTAPGATFDATQGYLDGTWRAYVEPQCVEAFTEHIATLFISHAPGATTVSGQYLWIATGEIGNLGGNIYDPSAGTFSVGILVDDDGSLTQMGFNCETTLQNLMTCRHTDGIAGEVYDALLLRQ